MKAYYYIEKTGLVLERVILEIPDDATVKDENGFDIRKMTIEEYAKSEEVAMNGKFIGFDLAVPLLNEGEVLMWDADREKVVSGEKRLTRAEFLNQKEAEGFEFSVKGLDGEMRTVKLKCFQEDQQQFANNSSVLTGMQVNGLSVPETSTFLDFYGVPQKIPTSEYMNLLIAYAGHCMQFTQEKWNYQEE